MPQDDIQSDEVLAMRTQQGHNYAFGMLVARYQAKLLRYGRRFLESREDVEDIVQDAFISAYRNIQGFDTHQRFSPWMYRIAHNAFVNALKRHSRAPLSFDLDTVIPHALLDDSQETERDIRDMRTLLERGMQDLPDKYREILVLHYFEDMPYADIADILQIPIGTVGVRLKRAREALKETYQSLEHPYGATA